MSDDVEQEVVQVIALATRQLTRRFPMLEARDIKQSLYEFATKKHDKLVEYLQSEDQRAGFTMAISSVSRHGERYCRKEKAALLGYRASDEFFYDRTLVMEMVRAITLGTTQRAVSDEQERRAPRSLAEGNNMGAMMADVQSALDALPDDERALVVLLSSDEATPSEIGVTQGVSRQVVEKRLERAVKKMVTYLGGSTPWS